MADTPIKVDVVMGGPGREAAVSRTSGAAIVEGLQAGGHDVQAVDIDGKLDPGRLRPDSLVFNIVHGTYGEDGTLQAELDAAGRAYIGSGAAASRLCMDKQATKERLIAGGLAVAWGKAIASAGFRLEDHPDIPAGPLVLKPRCDGSSVGLRMLASRDDLPAAVADVVRELGRIPMLIEERLAGPEYTVGVIQGRGDSIRALTPIRIISAVGTYDYQAKYHRDDTQKLFMEEEPLAGRLREIGEKVFTLCGCRDLARIDVMANGRGDLCVLEINTLPGFTRHSLLPKAAAHEGLTMEFLLSHLVQQASGRIRRCRCGDATGKRTAVRKKTR